MGLVAVGLLLDAWLVKSHRRTVSSFCRDNDLAVAAFVLIFWAHLARRFGKYDPFDALGRVFGLAEAT